MLFEKKEYKERLKKVKNLMQKQGIDLLVSHDPANMNYLTGYDAWSFYYAHCVLVHLDEVEKKINKPVFSSNQTLIWDTIRSAGYKNSISGYGKLLRI